MNAEPEPKDHQSNSKPTYDINHTVHAEINPSYQENTSSAWGLKNKQIK